MAEAELGCPLASPPVVAYMSNCRVSCSQVCSQYVIHNWLILHKPPVRTFQGKTFSAGA